MDTPAEVTCMECGGTAHLMSTPPPDEGFAPGDVAVYVCADCGERIDLVLDESHDPADG